MNKRQAKKMRMKNPYAELSGIDLARLEDVQNEKFNRGRRGVHRRMVAHDNIAKRFVFSPMCKKLGCQWGRDTGYIDQRGKMHGFYHKDCLSCNGYCNIRPYFRKCMFPTEEEYADIIAMLELRKENLVPDDFEGRFQIWTSNDEMFRRYYTDVQRITGWSDEEMSRVKLTFDQEEFT